MFKYYIFILLFPIVCLSQIKNLDIEKYSDILSSKDISIEEAIKLSKLQGISIEELIKELKLSDTQLIRANDTIVDEIKISKERMPIDTLSRNEDSILNKKINYFGYKIFENNPFGQKEYLLGNIDEGYLLAPGDELRINVYGNHSFSSVNKIDLNGNLIFKEFGPFQAAGISLKNIKEKLKIFLGKRFSGLILNPPTSFIDVSLTQIRPVNVNVIGEANTPGPHLVSGLATIINSLYAAGGVKTSGSLRSIYLYRNQKLLKKIDLYDFITSGNIDTDIRVMNSDVIFIPPRNNSIKLSGIVKNEGIYEIKKNENINDLINFSGGLLPEASTRNINISRIIPQSERKEESSYSRYLVTIDLKNENDFLLSDGDKIEIKSIPDKELNQAEIVGNVISPGIYSLLKFKDLKSLIIDGANGLAPNTYLNKIDIRKTNLDGTKSFNSYDLKDVLNNNLVIQLQNDDQIIVYNKEDVEGIFEIEIEGFGVINDNSDELENTELKNKKIIPWRENMSVFDLIFESTSFDDIEFQRKLLKSRVDLTSYNSETGEYTNNIYSIYDISKLKNTFLKPFDKVRIYSKNTTETIDKTIQIEGYVNSPKVTRLNDKMVVEDAILLGDGFQEYAIKDFVDIIRKKDNSNELNESIRYSIDKEYLLGLKDKPSNPFFLKHLDVVSVRKKIRVDINPKAEIVGEVQFPGFYNLESFDTTIEDLINKSGGTTEFSYIKSSLIIKDSIVTSILGNTSKILNYVVRPNDKIEIGSMLKDVTVENDSLGIISLFRWNKDKKARYYTKRAGLNSKHIISLNRQNGSILNVKGLKNPKVYPGDKIFYKDKEKKKLGDFLSNFQNTVTLLTSTLTTLFLITRI